MLRQLHCLGCTHHRRFNDTNTKFDSEYFFFFFWLIIYVWLCAYFYSLTSSEFVDVHHSFPVRFSVEDDKGENIRIHFTSAENYILYNRTRPSFPVFVMFSFFPLSYFSCSKSNQLVLSLTILLSFFFPSFRLYLCWSSPSLKFQ